MQHSSGDDSEALKKRVADLEQLIELEKAKQENYTALLEDGVIEDFRKLVEDLEKVKKASQRGAFQLMAAAAAGFLFNQLLVKKK